MAEKRPEYSSMYRFYENRIVEYFDDYENFHKAKNLSNYTGLQDFDKRPGYLSKFAKKNIETRLTPWLTSIKIYNQLHPEISNRKKRKPIFVTLTLSQKTNLTHQEIKRQLLQKFLERMMYSQKVQETFWKAELQKNGNLHFHLVLDHYINKITIQKSWNSIQRKHGLTEEYEKKFHKKEPPSTHVRSIQNMEKSIRYVMKYVSKNSAGKKINGNIYRFSKNLTDLKPFTFDNTINHTPGFMAFLKKNVDDAFVQEYFSVLHLSGKTKMDTLPEPVLKSYMNYYDSVYQKIYC